MPDDGARRRIIINGQSFAATGTRNHLHREKDLPAALLAETKHDPRAVGTIEQILKRRTGRYGNLLVSYRAEKKSLTFRHFKKSPLFDSQQLLKPPAINGSGYVVKSLEAAIWAFHNAEGYREAVLKAVNLGDDADTTGAVCGQFAGAYWGESGIPTEWLEGLARRDMIEQPLVGLLGSGEQVKVKQ